MKITKTDLMLLETLIRDAFINMPVNVMLSGERELVTERQHMMICYLKSSMSLLSSKGMLDKDISIELEESHHEALEDL
jgi:hypothetical protein